jgi:hypothetical protein
MQNMEKDMFLMNRAAQIMVAKMENITISECVKCKNGINGIPNCRPEECDLPIELVNGNIRICVVIANLIGDKWDFYVKDKTFDMYYIFGFDKEWNKILHVWKIPKKAILEHLGDLVFYRK